MSRAYLLRWPAGMVALTLGAAPAQGQPPTTRRYALVIANNHSLDADLEPLSFADDDGAKFFELFIATGAETALFTVLDPDAQRRYPEAARVVRAPREVDVLAEVDRMFAMMRRNSEAGVETSFYFVYSGHGNVGPNREGYLNLLDSRFGRSRFYREILARSPATWNHIILDACHAYFLVEKRGGQPDKGGDFRHAVQSFLRSEDLVTYPNTGVILAASSESETHEWSRWRAGVFSHELRSALLGAADVDGDGGVTYAEAAAAIEAANAAVDDPVAKLRVYARPPAARIEQPLIDLAWLQERPALRFDRGTTGHYAVEDSRGLRIADMHPSGESSGFSVLLGSPPFFVRNPQNEEATIPEERGTVALGALTFEPQAMTAKGSLEETYRRHLFGVPFGTGFLHGFLAATGHGAADWDGWYGSPGAEPRIATLAGAPPEALDLLDWAWITLGAGAALGAAGAVVAVMANDTHNDYLEENEPAEVRRLKKKTKQQALAANILFGGAGAAGLTGILLMIVHGTVGEASAIEPAVMGDAVVGVRWHF